LSSIATITICSNRCFIKLPPPAFLLRTLRRRSAAFFAGKGTRPWFSPRSRAWTSTGAKSSLKVGGIHFDHLIISTGAQHAYFGNGDWAFSAPGLKTIDDATYLRRRILLAFERAETELDPAEQRRLLNFVVVGDGPTGVEMAGAIAELARRALLRISEPSTHGWHVSFWCKPGRGSCRPSIHRCQMRRFARSASSASSALRPARPCGPPASWHRRPEIGSVPTWIARDA
jgi:Pyridine nucleotide-disulphide oxidoreductase